MRVAGEKDERAGKEGCWCADGGWGQPWMVKVKGPGMCRFEMEKTLCNHLGGFWQSCA